MGQVTISFLGVCTIFRDLPSLQRPPDLPPGTVIPMNRVVLARVQPDSNPPIEPHIARLQLVASEVFFDPGPPPDVDPNAPFTYTLNGVKLRVVNAAGAKVSGCLCGLPGMQAHLDHPLGGPALPVYLEDPARVQAWFDLDFGQAAAYIMRTEQPCNPFTEVPSITVVTIETIGDPILEYRPFGGGDPILIVLSGNGPNPAGSPNVNVMNFAFGEGVRDDPNDYLLNYELAFDRPPASAVKIPERNTWMELSPLTYEIRNPSRCGDAGPGCSTTPFP